jgi:hypothetical protein
MLSLATDIFLFLALLLANFVFRYFDQAFGSTISKVTFIMTLIGTIGLFFSVLVMMVGLITFSPALMLIGAILTLFTLPALLVFYILWGVSFIMVREDVSNPSLMLAGGILYIIGIFVPFVTTIGTILVTIVMFGEGGA